MNIISSFWVAVGLSMDNLAVTVSAGCGGGKCPTWIIWQISLLFAAAHFAMFSLGFEGGMLVHAGRRWGAGIACGILVFIGIRMITNALCLEPTPKQEILTSLKTQLALAVATSLDALFVGAGLALAQAPFWQTQAALALCVFITSLCGFYLGSYLGKKFGQKMEVLGGVVLVLLGVKVLLEGIGIW